MTFDLAGSTFANTVKTWTNEELLGMLRGHLEVKTQKDLADEIGISEAFLSNVKNEKDPVSLKIAEWLVGHPLEVRNLKIFRQIA